MLGFTKSQIVVFEVAERPYTDNIDVLSFRIF